MYTAAVADQKSSAHVHVTLIQIENYLIMQHVLIKIELKISTILYQLL